MTSVDSNVIDQTMKNSIGIGSEKSYYDSLLTSQNRINDIFVFVANGNITKCVELVNTFGSAVLNQYNDKGIHVLHSACIGGFIEIVIMVLTQGVYSKLEEFYTALSENKHECIKIDPCIVTRNEKKETPLHFASSYNRVEVIELLLNIAVPIDIVDATKRTPLHLSIDTKKTEATIYLIAKGADINVMDQDKDTCLHWAANRGSVDHISLFLNLGLDVNQPDSFLMTPTHLAAVQNFSPAIKAILSASPNLTIKDSRGRTPLDVAIEKKNTDVARDIFNQINKHSFYSRVCNPKLLWKIFQIYLFFCAVFYMYVVMCTANMSGILLFIKWLSIAIFIAWLILLYSVKRTRVIFSNKNIKLYVEFIYSCNSYSKMKEMLALRSICHRCGYASDKNTFHCSYLDRCVDDYEIYDVLLGSCITKRSRSNYIKLCVTYMVFNMLAVIFLLLNKMILILLVCHVVPLIQIMNRMYLIYYSYKNNIPIGYLELMTECRMNSHKH